MGGNARKGAPGREGRAAAKARRGHEIRGHRSSTFRGACWLRRIQRPSPSVTTRGACPGSGPAQGFLCVCGICAGNTSQGTVQAQEGGASQLRAWEPGRASPRPPHKSGCSVGRRLHPFSEGLFPPRAGPPTSSTCRCFCDVAVAASHLWIGKENGEREMK